MSIKHDCNNRELRVGDYVERVSGSFKGMEVGDTSFVLGFKGSGVVLKGYEGNHTNSYFKKVDNVTTDF